MPPSQPVPRKGFLTSLRIALASILAGLSGTFLSVMGLRMYGIDLTASDGLQVILFMALALCAYLGQEINLRLRFERSPPPLPLPAEPMIAEETPAAFPPIFDEDDEESDEKFALRAEDDAVPFSPPYQSQPISEAAARQVVAAAMQAANTNAPIVRSLTPQMPNMSAEDAAAFLSHHAKRVLEKLAAATDAAVLAADPQALPQPLDPFTVFGVHLYLAGAAGELTRRFLLSFDHGRFLYTRMLETVDVDHARAIALAVNANIFATVPSFQPMIETGIADATAHIDRERFSEGALSIQCEAWKALAADHRAPVTVSALSTRIGRLVLATAVSGEDRRRIFRIYNSMIGLTAERFAGRSSVRSSDGAVLLFDDIEKAAQAALFMQQEMDVLEQVRTLARYQLSTGVDQGLMVEAAGHFYGSALHNARRLADCAAPKTICISEIISNAIPAETENMSFFHLPPEAADIGPAFTLRWVPRIGRPLRDLEYREIGSAANA